MLTQNINRVLGSAYTVEQVRWMDPEQLSLLEILLAVQNNPTLADEMWEPPVTAAMVA